MPCSNSDGINLHYLTRGNGPDAIVFIHGFCQSSLFWETTLDLLPDRFCGYALDLPGFGDSSKSEGSYSIPELADDVLSFADSKGLERFILAGNSMGGVVSQSFAARFGNRLDKLVLVSTGANVATPDAALEKADFMDQMEWARGFFETAVKGFFAELPNNWERYVEGAMKANRQAMVQCTRSSASLNLLEDDRSIRVPTLIVQGEKDAGRTPEDGRRLQEAISDSVLHILPGSGHTPMLERPDLFNPIFLEFIER
jgi:pimeloyl-ACP methyl ester carboxylesterase